MPDLLLECPNCGKFGHINEDQSQFCAICQECFLHHTTKCPNLPPCKACGQKGHTLKDCPDLNPKTDMIHQRIDQNSMPNKSVQSTASSQQKNTGTCINDHILQISLKLKMSNLSHF